MDETTSSAVSYESVVLRADPESGMCMEVINEYVRGALVEYPNYYRRVLVPVDQVALWRRTLEMYGVVQAQMGRLFELATSAGPKP